MEQEVKIGSIVLMKMNPMVKFPAIVTAVFEDNVVDLRVFSTFDTISHTRVAKGDDELEWSFK
jgi:hypothetical protein